MPRKVYKKIQLVGSSSEGIEGAIGEAVSTAGMTLRNLDWFEVIDIRGDIDDGEVSTYQVTLNVGFRMERGDEAFGD